MTTKTAEIICIGTEILMGDIVNTNAAYIAKELTNLGITMYHQTVVGDNPKRLKESLELAFSRSDVVITTGGLGPTYDDLSKETILARVWGYDSDAVENHVEVYIGFLRKKLLSVGSNVRIVAIRRLGYHLEVAEDD